MRRVLSAIETVAALFLLVIALLTAGNVLLRDLAAVQVPDWFDGSRLLQGIALFWGFALATYAGSHICVDVLWEHLGPQRRRLLDVAATALTLLFVVPLAWMVWVKVAGTGAQGTMDLRLPLKPFYAVAALGATLAALLGVLRLVRLVRGEEHLLRPDGAGVAPEAGAAAGALPDTGLAPSAPRGPDTRPPAGLAEPRE